MIGPVWWWQKKVEQQWKKENFMIPESENIQHLVTKTEASRITVSVSVETKRHMRPYLG